MPLLVENVALNGLQDRLQVHPVAAGASSGTAKFDAGPVDQTGWGGLTHETTSSIVEVPVTRLDDALAEIGEISVLKIDVEGADAWVLEGAEQLLRERRVEHVFFERQPSSHARARNR